MKSLRVLITGVGSTTSLSVIKGLRKQQEYDVFIVGTDTNVDDNIAGSAFCDLFFQVPSAGHSGEYVAAIQELVSKHSIDLFIPIINDELEIIAENRKAIEKSTYVLLSSYDTVLTCNDKCKTFKFFNDLGLPTLKTIDVAGSRKPQELLSESGITFPFFAKPRKGLGSSDVYEIRNKEEIGLINRIKDPIIQEKALGQEYTIDVFCDGEKMITAVPRSRLETKSGISYKGKTEKDYRLVEYARIISEKLKIKGPANIQCFKKDDEVRFTEINSRFSGGLSLTIQSGVNTPLLALKLAAGEKLKVIEDFEIVEMCRYWDEVFYNETGELRAEYNIPRYLEISQKVESMKFIRGCKIGEGTKIYPFANFYNCEIGNNCMIGPFVEIQKGVKIGNNVRVQSHTSLCEGVTVEDDVFVGHGVVFINDKHPTVKAAIENKWELKKTLVKKGASIGSNATILPVTIGENAIIGAGSVVVKDVPANTVVAGNPVKELHKLRNC
jgi:carbamoyl-phosphate synthase large subunit